MESFERAHVVKNMASKNRKFSENKKKQLRQMLFGYKANDIKLIQSSAELQNDYEDSTSVSCYSDLNLTNSSYEDDNATFMLNKDTSSRYISPNSNSDEKISEDSIYDSSESYKSSELSNTSARSDDSYDNESNEDKLCFSEESISEHNSSIDCSDRNDFRSKDFVVEAGLESGTDSETSIVLSGLNLSGSDISEFDADGQLAAKIRERLQLKEDKQKHKDKYTIVLGENNAAKGPITNERCNTLDTIKGNPMTKEESTRIKINKQKHKDKYTIVLNENNVEKSSVSKERWSTAQADKVLGITKEESKRTKNNNQKHDKYTLLLDSSEEPKGPITKERCSVIQAETFLQMKKEELTRIKNNKQKHRNKYTILLNPSGTVSVEMSEDESSINSDELSDDELNEDIDSAMSLPFVSITASDMPTQRLDDIIGEYKHSTIKNIPSEMNNVFSTNNSGVFVEENMIVDQVEDKSGTFIPEFDDIPKPEEENMNVDVYIEDDVSSLIPEFDDIPKPEEIDEIINLDTTTETINRTICTKDTVGPECASEKDQSIDYDQVAETFKVYYGTNCCIITLKYPSELFIQGKVKVKCLGGTVELFGYTLNTESYNIYAPYYSVAQGIRTVENQNVYYGLFSKLTAAGISVSEAEEIVTTLGEHDGVILLKEVKSRAMDFVEKNFRVTNMFKWNKTVEPYFSKASDMLHCSLFSSRPYKSFHEHPSWREAHELAMIKNSRGIVCGGKGAGKSTYVRYQVNKLLAHGPVLVVDLDPGQCLFTVAGNVSATVVTSPLLGPSFTHLRKPELMLNIGMINTMDNAKLYAAAVRALITDCRNNKSFTDMPWIVNTMGMTNSLGLKFITLVINLLQPTYVLQYDSEAINQRFATLLTPTSIKDLFEEFKSDRLFKNEVYTEDLDYSFVVAHGADSPHMSKSTFSLSPKNERYLNFLAYFSQLLASSHEDSLLGITPYMVNLKDLRIATNVVIKKEQITKVLNGKLVALCQHAGAARDSELFTLTDKPLLCRGHGLIRGIDWDKEVLYVLTPVPSEELGSVDTLLYADWAPEPVWQEPQLPVGTPLPYRTSSAEQHKQLMSTPRRRFNNPLQLLKMAGRVPN